MMLECVTFRSFYEGKPPNESIRRRQEHHVLLGRNGPCWRSPTLGPGEGVLMTNDFAVSSMPLFAAGLS